MNTPARSRNWYLLLVVLAASAPRSVYAADADTTTARIPIVNPGFESKLEGWSTHVYGAQPKIETDSTHSHAGKQSIRVSCAEPTDTAFGQELTLRAGHWYRFRGWVKTENLVPQSATVVGTFQIQTSGGSSVIAGGPNHRGNTDWTNVSIEFEAQVGGNARIAIFFAGYGHGTGTAWFDDLTLEEIDVSDKSLRITRDFLPGKINPMQYGQFIEYLCDLVPCMWAEKLYDGSFEGPSPYKTAFLKETDFREKPWYPHGAVNRAEYQLDREQPVGRARCDEQLRRPRTRVTCGVETSGERSEIRLQVPRPIPDVASMARELIRL